MYKRRKTHKILISHPRVDGDSSFVGYYTVYTGIQAFNHTQGYNLKRNIKANPSWRHPAHNNTVLHALYKTF